MQWTFFAWACKSDGEIRYHMITQEEYEQNSTEIETRKEMIKPIKGTISLHAITTDVHGQLVKRNTTCACKSCFNENGFDGQSPCGWDKVEVLKQPDPTRADEHVVSEASDELELTTYSCNKNDFVVAVYDTKCYIGKIIEKDLADDTVHVDFMIQSGKALQQFRWPNKQDRVWVKGADILRVIQEPTATGKGGRMFTVPDEVLNAMASYAP
ncbi:hypothetical protein SNE40_018129 [Patella caerulea]|uniref:Uncharacterized protein n=2 Tax=Patella caerulea TaxID=87958 RepID=A0AAN8PB08_PATCE